MWRVALGLIIGGGVMCYFGIQEFIVSRGTSSDPVAADMAKLEAGEKPANNYVVIGKHVAVYPQVVYSYQKNKNSSGVPSSSTSVNYAYYPIISANHPFNTEWDDLIRKYGSLQNIPLDVPLPAMDKVAVLVKTRRFKTVGSIPMSVDKEDSVKGLIINDIDSLDSEEEKVVRQGLPGIDVGKVLILEQGREPASLFKSMGLSGGGVLLILVGLGLFLVKGKKG